MIGIIMIVLVTAPRMLSCHYLFMCLCPSGGSGELISTHLGIPGPSTVCDAQMGTPQTSVEERKGIFPSVSGSLPPAADPCSGLE